MIDFDLDLDIFSDDNDNYEYSNLIEGDGNTEKKPKIKFYKEQKDILKSKENKIIISGGFGSGKTVIGLYKFIRDFVPENGVGLCTGYSSQLLKEIMIDSFEKLNIEYVWKEYQFIFIVENTKRLILVALDNYLSFRRVRSVNVDALYCDEITLQDYKGIKESMSRVRRGKETKFIWTTNPDTTEHWVYKEYIKKGITHFSLKTTDNPYLPKDYIENMINYPKGSGLYRRYVEGIWGESEEQPFSSIKVVEFGWGVATRGFLDTAFGGEDRNALTLGYIVSNHGIPIPRVGVYTFEGHILKNINNIKKLLLDKNCYELVVEINADHGFVKNAIKKELLDLDITVKGYRVSGNKTERILRVISSSLNQLELSNDSNCIHEIVNWSTVSGKRNNSKDDSVDSLASWLMLLNNKERKKLIR